MGEWPSLASGVGFDVCDREKGVRLLAFALLFIGSFWMELGGLVNQSLRTACLGVSSPTWPIPRDLGGPKAILALFSCSW